jgi:Phage capsid family
MATIYADFVPVSIAREVLASVGDRLSAVMKLARVINMPSGLESVPVVSVAPTAAFVTPMYGGRKPRSSIEWTATKLVPEELAVTLAIPNAFLSDAGFPVWDSVRDEIARAIAKTFDDAALLGTGAPASFPTGGLVGPANADAVAGAADPAAAIDMAFGNIEGKGMEVSGVLGGPALNGVMRRGSAAMVGAWEAPPSAFYGVPYATSTSFTAGAGPAYRLALVGDWQYVVVAIREDIRFDLSTEGVLTDAGGAIQVNAFQDDSTLMRAYMRVGLAVGKPLGPAGSVVKPLALSTTTTAFTLMADEPEGDEDNGGSLPRTHAELDELADARGIAFSSDDLTVAEKRAELGG